MVVFTVLIVFIRAEQKNLNRIKNHMKIVFFCGAVVTYEHTMILGFNEDQKFGKTPYII